jgi:CRISPR/Cas system-associated protein Cas7 (RAMP superfamily)
MLCEINPHLIHSLWIKSESKIRNQELKHKYNTKLNESLQWLSQSYPQSRQPVEKKLSTGVSSVKMLSITFVDIKKREKRYPHHEFSAQNVICI